MKLYAYINVDKSNVFSIQTTPISNIFWVCLSMEIGQACITFHEPKIGIQKGSLWGKINVSKEKLKYFKAAVAIVKSIVNLYVSQYLSLILQNFTFSTT